MMILKLQLHKDTVNMHVAFYSYNIDIEMIWGQKPTPIFICFKDIL